MYKRKINTRSLFLLMGGVAAGALAVSSPGARAQTAAPIPADAKAEIDELRSEVRELAGEVRELKKQQAEQIQTLSTAQNAAPGPAREPVGTVTASPPPPGSPLIPPLAANVGGLTVNLHSIVQLDAADYDQDTPGPLTSDFRRDGAAVGSPGVDSTHARQLKNGDLFRRARVGADGRDGDDFSYRIMFDFGGAGVENAGQLYEGWVQYGGFRPFRIRVGAFRPSLGLEDQTSASNLLFIERPAATDTAAALAGSDTRTALQFFGFEDRWFAALAVTGRQIGVISTANASPTPVSYGDQLGFTGRLNVTPVAGADWGVHVGVHGSYLDRPANTVGPSPLGPQLPNTNVVAFNDTPELRVDSTKLINTGNIPANHAATMGPEFAAQYKSFLVQSEYEHIVVDRTDIVSTPAFNGWWVEGTWLLTGESHVWNSTIAAFDAPVIAHQFSPKTGGWGAWELALRYSDMDLNYHAGSQGVLPETDAIRGGNQKIFTAGMNWYLDPLVRLVFDYQRVNIDRLSPCTLASSESCTSVWLTPVGAQIGQSYNSFTLRTQLAF
jgi:phosphate-selective porin OprO/OprP